MENNNNKVPQKKFINNKQDVVIEALTGLCLSNPQLNLLKNQQTIILKTPVSNKVNLLCGGGSGHEPAHVGYVDEKILHAAVCGGVFASPSYQQVLTSINHLGHNNNGQGVLVIIKNYTGDVINFELASGFARTQGIKVKTLVIGDDIAFLDTENQGQEEIQLRKKEARGLSGTVFIYKVLGAAAFKGKSLDYIHQLGLKIKDFIHSLGVSMSPCSIPGFPANFQLESDEMEIGLGIHGEQGKGRQKITKVNEIVRQMLEKNFFQFLKKNDEVAILVNNLGSCTDIEMCIFEKCVLEQLQSAEIKVLRIVEGRIMTSLEMQGILLTIFNLQQEFKEEVLEYLDLPVDTKHWNIQIPVQNDQEFTVNPNVPPQNTYNKTQKILSTEESKQLLKNLNTLFQNLISKESYFNELDSVVGDGDTGSGVSRASQAVLQNLEYLQLDSQFADSIISIGEIIANSFGGTSGPLYGNFLACASQHLNNDYSQNDLLHFCKAFQAGVQGVQDLGKAELGERTMYDVLYPLGQEFERIINEKKVSLNSSQVATQLLEKATQLAFKAQDLKAKKGRARYLGGKEVGHKDPGCELVVEWISIIRALIIENI